MTNKKYLLSFLLGCSFSAWANNFNYHISPLSSFFQQQIAQYTWHAGCPVAINQLRLLQLSYWGIDNKTHQGELVVNSGVAPTLALIFQALYQLHFPIAKMAPLIFYTGDEDKAMADNDTFVFHCRPTTGDSHNFSWHAYGQAIDINPLWNPYIKNTLVLPPTAEPYLNRQLNQAGLIKDNAAIIKIFSQQNWQWGGHWQTLKDYQHFEYTKIN